MDRRRAVGAGIVGVLLSARASAQPGGGKLEASRAPRSGGGRGGPIRLPVFLDLKKVPVGSWAEYTVTQGGRPQRTVRQTLVGRDKASATVEVILERGRSPSRAAIDRKVTAMVVDLELKEIAPRKTIVQWRDADPTDLSSVQDPRRQRLLKLDPTKSLGSETVQVPAGTFKTQHYRNPNPRGGTIDIWASSDVPPFGLVRLERKPGPNAPPARAALGNVTYALVGMGTGAKPAITKPAKPANPSLLQCRERSPKR
jgi:hypothetical protein